MTKTLCLAACLGLFGQSAPDWAKDAKIAPVAVGQAPNSSAFGSRIYFAGQPSTADLAEYAKLGVKTIVNLRSPAEMAQVGFDEAAAAKSNGMRYVNVPVGGTMPTDGELAKIYAELNKSGNEKVLMHCASSNRVGMTWALYRGTQHGMSGDAALAEGKSAGLKAPALEKLAKEKLGVKP